MATARPMAATTSGDSTASQPDHHAGHPGCQLGGRHAGQQSVTAGGLCHRGSLLQPAGDGVGATASLCATDYVRPPRSMTRGSAGRSTQRRWPTAAAAAATLRRQQPANKVVRSASCRGSMAGSISSMATRSGGASSRFAAQYVWRLDVLGSGREAACGVGLGHRWDMAHRTITVTNGFLRLAQSRA